MPMHTPDPTDQQIAAVVVSALDEAGIDWHVAADRAGIARTTMRRRLEGHTSFTVPELIRVAALIETTPAEILTRAGQVVAA